MQIRGIVEAYGCQREEFRRKWDHIKRYMKENKIPKEVCTESGYIMYITCAESCIA